MCGCPKTEGPVVSPCLALGAWQQEGKGAVNLTEFPNRESESCRALMDCIQRKSLLRTVKINETT